LERRVKRISRHLAREGASGRTNPFVDAKRVAAVLVFWTLLG